MPPKLTVTVSDDESEAGSQKVLLAGLPFTHSQISAFLSRAKAEMPLRPVRFPILGEYLDCFAGEEFVTWLLENVPEFQKDLDIVVVAARELTEREDLLRRLGEFGNKFDNADDVYYQFRPKVIRVPSQSLRHELTSGALGFYAGSAAVDPDCKEVPYCWLALGPHCPGNRKDLWYPRGYREQGVGLKRRTPLHSTQEGSDECRNRVPDGYSVSGSPQTEAGGKD